MWTCCEWKVIWYLLWIYEFNCTCHKELEGVECLGGWWPEPIHPFIAYINGEKRMVVLFDLLISSYLKEKCKIIRLIILSMFWLGYALKQVFIVLAKCKHQSITLKCLCFLF